MKVVYSCVVDKSYKFQYQGWLWVNSLIMNGQVEPQNIYMHCIKGIDEEFKKLCASLSVNVLGIEPFGDGKYCNKIAQMFTSQFQKADMVVLMDTDTFLVENFEKYLNPNLICAKPTDAPNPPINVFEKIFNLSGIKKSLGDMKVSIEDSYTYGANFNGGLYCIPVKYLDAMRDSWSKWANWLLDHVRQTDRIEFPNIHIDQMSFCMAIHENEFPIQELDISFNFPFHILTEAVREPYMLHYHWKIDATGLIETVSDDILNSAIEKANTTVRRVFNNNVYWNYRYEVNPELGSGTGSRGVNLNLKKLALKMLGIESYASVLDIGFGDLELMKDFNIKEYQGFDISNEAIKMARTKRPDWNFDSIYDLSLIEFKKYEYVQCLDVLIHQKTREDFDKLLNFAIKKTEKRLFISGFTTFASEYEANHVLGFYGSLKDKLTQSGKFKSIEHILTIGCADYYVCDVELDNNEATLEAENRALREKIEALYSSTSWKITKPLRVIKQLFRSTQTISPSNSVSILPNDMPTEIVRIAFKNTKYPSHLHKIIESSRKYFGWYTKHFPRIYEYPWLYDKLKNVRSKKIGDLGAGITPMPILFAQDGAFVFTIDNSRLHRSISDLNEANEWGFLDYSELNENIVSYNSELKIDTFEHESFDCWYSISVIEHVPADTRRSLLFIIKCLLKPKGEFLLTVDLAKDSEYLHNMNSGEIVEDKLVHGTLEDLKSEIIELGFVIHESCVLKMPQNEKVDIALIHAQKQ